MPKTLSDPFVAANHSKAKSTGKRTYDGRHNEANKRLKDHKDPGDKPLWVPKNQRNIKKAQRATIITRYLNMKMKTRLEKKKDVYYKDKKGIEMNYPPGSERRDLAELKIVSDNGIDNNFNVFIGCERKNKNKATFVVLKVSKDKKVIARKKMEKYNKSLEGLLKNKPSVLRGSARKGVMQQQYVCHGFRKNPLNKEIGEYAYKRGVNESTKKEISEDINNLVGEIESRAISEMEAANLQHCSGCNAFDETQAEFGLTSIHEKGRATQFAVSKAYCSPSHADNDFFYTVLSVDDKKAKPDEVLYHFCFPTYGIAVPMTKGDIIMFNPLIAHCATNPRKKTSLIYSAYVSNKTCNTIVANNTRTDNDTSE